ncbi:hypothetical protein [Pseudomonas koreensis]|uniref:hypothetical protein n=1 Tax=Pseudomonas koreensis TaxID=198620 RepID=UPI0018E6DAEE|nr:hypothetical protein [Pseudomonas koreensis]MBI6947319.1 hypothetical protein [Pseudomonas koreensis]
MGDTDSPDFNKARGFLIGYSLVVALLWFFGADLTQFKLMGNEIYLKENIRHVWIVIAAINFYLLLRFYQRLSHRSLRFDEHMHATLDRVLLKVCKFSYRSKAFKYAASIVEKQDDGKLIKLNMNGYLNYRDHLEREMGRDEYSPTGPWDYSYPNRVKITFILGGEFIKEGAIIKSSGGMSYDATPNRTLYAFSIVYAFLKGAMGLAWFTDNIWPLMFGSLSTGIAVYKWWQIHHLFRHSYQSAFNQVLFLL